MDVIIKRQEMFGNKLKMLRKQKGLTQEELSRLINKSSNSIRQLEGGLIYPNFETLAEIVKALDIDANLLFSKIPVKYPEKVKWIAGIFAEMDNDEKQAVGKFLKDLAFVLETTLTVGGALGGKSRNNENCDL